MGNTTKSPEDYDIVRNYRKEDWLKYEFGYRCELWKNKLTNQLVEVYQLPEMPSSKDLDRYSFRSKNTDLVTVYFVAHDNNETICTRSGEVQVLTEYIPIRLAEINYLDNAEGLTMLRTCFSGFNTITMFEPELEPNEEMIGLNEVGETKVWLNRNFSVNTPENV